jgi:polysaccharide export outer membrane protein
MLIFSAGAAAQIDLTNMKRDKVVGNEIGPTPPKTAETPVPDTTDPAAVVKTDGVDLTSAEAQAIVPVYNNYLSEYQLGPNDVITVEVFGQCPDYCKAGITVPPTARISYPLVREGVMVGGKTVTQVADEITKKLDEYIIDPKVTVTLEKAMSARYSVLGKVVAPGVRVLDRKISVYEAVVESGGVSKDGDKKKVIIYSYNGQGKISSKIVNLTEIERGRGEMVFINPGDQIFVSGKGFTVDKVFDILGKLSMARFLFGSPF